MLQILGPSDDVIFEHNTAFPEQELMTFGGPDPKAMPNRFTQRFVFRNNIVATGSRGIKGSGTAAGIPTLEFHAPGYVFEGNVILGNGPGSFPGKNFIVGDWKKVQFVNFENGDYRLSHASKYRKAAGGKDPGADMDALEKATAGVVVNSKPPAQ